MYMDLSGTWQCGIPGQEASVRLPGTLDENRIGEQDDPARQWKVEEVRRIGFYAEGDPIVTRLTRKHTFEGMARLTRRIDWEVPEKERIFIDVERARSLRLLVNGKEAVACRPGNISTPYTFEITGLVTGSDELEFQSDNSYPGWPRDAIVYASAASDETQTNWNGLLGYIRLRTEKSCHISDVRAYPRGNCLDVCVEMNLSCGWQGKVVLQSDALQGSGLAEKDEKLPRGKHEIWFRDMPLRKDVKTWDLEEGNLCSLTVSGEGMDSRQIRFGVRDFRAANGHLLLNGRRIFLRGEANCAVFPETGYIPMDTDAWLKILKQYRAYGVNCMRFHSHCPPEAAFAAADQLGMLMQPELSHWDPEHAFASEESRNYYQAELLQILRHLANHPSFVMLTFGNELQADAAGHDFMNRLLQTAREYDPTRLYSDGSNVHYGQIEVNPHNDFYTAMQYKGLEMRATCDGPTGWLNTVYPNSERNYQEAAGRIQQASGQPVFSFEVGQYEVLPDFDEIEAYQGVTSPENLKHIRQKVQEKGLEPLWKQMTEATGESSLLCYRAEVESALRTEEYSGISLLGLQDFPGQGTALVGMMNAHLQPKPFDFARPERFAAFFRDALPMVLLPGFTYTAGETLTAAVKIANYGKTALKGAAIWKLEGENCSLSGTLPEKTAAAGALTELGAISTAIPYQNRPQKLCLSVCFCGISNSYPIWIYPEVHPVCPENVYECRELDERAEAILRDGGRVYLAPDSTAEALPHSIPAQFSPDFWSVCTFPHQAGSMGQLIDSSHPLFRDFPTESYSNWQWWPMATQRAMILPERMDAIITEIDSYALLRPMAKLFECRCLKGRILVSSMGLQQLQQYPETRALQHSIYAYLNSDDFCPKQSMALSALKGIFTKKEYE